MVMNFIMLVAMYPIVLILYFVFKNTCKDQNGSLFAVNMKPEWKERPEVQAVVEKFNSEMKQYFLLLLVLPLTSFLTGYVSVQLTIWMLWMLLAIVLLCLPLVHANSALKEWKKEQHLYGNMQMERLVELKSLGKIRRVKLFPFLIPNFLAGIVTIAAYAVRHADLGINIQIGLKNVSWLCLVMWLCGLLLWRCAVWMDRQPVTVISTDSDVNLNYTRARKNIWKNFWLVVTWCNTAFVAATFLTAFLTEEQGKMLLIFSVLYTLLITVLCFPLVKQLRSVENAYRDRRNLTEEAEDDRCWIGGIFYYNPEDKHTIVQKKVGVGTTMNLATPIGKGSMILSALLLVLLIPGCCIWVLLLEFTPIRLQIEDQTLYARQLNTNYEVEVEQIEDLEKITELPGWSKVSGSAMDTLEEGTFFIRNVGKCEVFLNPENTVFLHFSAAGIDYYMSGYDDAQTEEIYQLLTQQ